MIRSIFFQGLIDAYQNNNLSVIILIILYTISRIIILSNLFNINKL